jgi:hypothetical protein
MPRNISAAYLAALSAKVLYPALFVQAAFRGEVIFLWSGLGEKAFNGNTWQGVGGLLGCSTIEEGSDVEAKGMALSLSGIDNKLLPACLNSFQIGLPVTVFLALMDNLGNIIPNPAIAFAGRMDQPTFDIDATTSTISVACESRLLAMNTPVPYRYTNQDQQLFFPGDLGFSWVNSIQNVPLYWNTLPNSDGNP